MKNKHLVMLLLSSCCLAACVDSKYDLSDVNTDDAVMGESWVAPLGMGYVTSDDVVNVEKVPSIREVDGAYVMIYAGMPLWIVACPSRLRTQVKRRLLPLILPCQRCLLIFGSALLIRRRMLLSLSRTRSYRESYRLFLKKYICLCPLIANNGRTLLRMP